MAVRLTRMDGGTVDLSPEALQAFKAAFKGRVLTAEDAEYEESRDKVQALLQALEMADRGI